MKTSNVMACAIVASLAVVGCSTPTSPVGAPSAASRPWAPFGAKIEPILPCGSSVPTPSAAETYIITINNRFELRHAVVAISGHPQSGKPPKHPHKTLLHLNTDLKDGQSATIKIVLADTLLSFQDVGLAIRGGDDDAPKIFCSVVYKNGDRELSFTVHRDAGGPTYASYNLGLIATDKNDSNYDLPIFIDPGVENNG